MLAKIDISRAFRNLRVNPADVFKFGIKWKNKSYLDRIVAFGWVHSSAAFQMTSDAVIHIMAKEKCQIFAYINDFILVSQETDTDCHFDKRSALFTELGISMNTDKRTPPTRSLTCLGITIDLDNNSLSIDKYKLEEIYTECIKVRLSTL